MCPVESPCGRRSKNASGGQAGNGLFFQHQALMQPEPCLLCTAQSSILSHRACTGLAQRSVHGALPCCCCGICVCRCKPLPNTRAEIHEALCSLLHLRAIACISQGPCAHVQAFQHHYAWSEEDQALAAAGDLGMPMFCFETAIKASSTGSCKATS